MLSGKKLVEFAKSKVGTPYVYGAKGADGKFTQAKLDFLAKNYKSVFTTSYINKSKKYIGVVCTDCSGLISWYTGKVYGSSQLYSKASKRIKARDYKNVPAGAVVWRQGHVGVYDGNGYVYEAKGIDYGTIKSKFVASKWTYFLLFDWMTYDYTVESDKKANNPYKEPTVVLTKGATGEGVKWLQYELIQAGYKTVKVNGKSKTLEIDGCFGDITKTAVGLFQQSCKLTVDYKVGSLTRKALKG